ncbi:hypothetical protein [Ruania halotolerans]|uniref:hypothetical protein n=1 Tax=Ruania halotolerans TaxID=2897773 RepID=UPI001E605840|nr:hypothetical protein [Ruania halotolerans]UFU06675.1 hypothetical protein LQF10_00755 [Ruania halotolerans]
MTLPVSLSVAERQHRPDPDPGTTAETASRARAAALDVPQVIDLHTGRLSEVRTYLPGRTIPGVRLVNGTVHVHVLLALGSRIPDVAGAVHEAVATATGAPVLVHVDELAAPDHHERDHEEHTR